AMKKLSMLALLVLSLALIVPAMAQTGSTANKTPVAAGAKMKTKGMIIRRDQGNLIIRDQSGSELTVRTAGAKIEEKKSNPFRGSKKYSETQLARGLYIEVEGHGDSSGVLIAEKIKLADDDFRVAQAVESTVVPV